MKNVETLYRLKDGTQADPKDCTTGKDGVLRHQNGIAVAIGADGKPETIGDQAAEGGNLRAAAGVSPAETKVD